MSKRPVVPPPPTPPTPPAPSPAPPTLVADAQPGDRVFPYADFSRARRHWSAS